MQLIAFAIPVFLGAFLLFQVQPLVARRILPWFGGGASVWTACMLFFQMALLAGYMYAHAAVKARRLVLFHLGLLLAAVLCLPITPSEFWKPEGNEQPVLRILLLLSATVGIPYLALASTSPLVQSLFARTMPGRSPYRLFALSNAGSLLGLLTYPVLIEPALGLDAQAWLWSGGFAVYALSVAYLIYRTRSALPVVEVAGDEPLPTAGTQALWVLFPACASTLLLAATGYVTQNLPPTPFLWVLPLTAYLLSFILVFDAERWCPPKLVTPAVWVGLACLVIPLVRDQMVYELPWIAGLVTAGVLIVSVYLHGETARRKPPSAHLTRFYLMISVGGALGGLLVGVAAPLTVPEKGEYYIAVLACAMAALLLQLTLEPMRKFVAMAASVAISASVITAWKEERRVPRISFRNFYGALHVQDEDVTGVASRIRSLIHGITIHGTQILAPPELSRRATSYYAESTGVHRAIEKTRRAGQQVGIVGLGTGTIAAWGHPGDEYTFYEINPQDVHIATTMFTYLKDTPARVRIVQGDGRLALQRDKRQFDVLAVDAFSSDAIPVHLLTREAVQLYFEHLRQGGVLALHISNVALNLEPVVSSIAQDLRLATAVVDSDDDDSQQRSGATWALLARDASSLPPGRPAEKSSLRVWTDDYSSIWPILQ